MKREYFMISAALCVAAVFAFNSNLLSIGSAAADEDQSSIRGQIKSWSQQPMVFARFESKDTGLLKGQDSEPDHCLDSPSFQSSKTASSEVLFVDFCGPVPSAVSKSKPKADSKSKWQLPKSPQRIIWQQDVLNNQRLRVELVDADRLPWPAKFNSSKLGNKETIQIQPAYKLPSNREMYLLARLSDEAGNRLANWVLPLVLKSGSESRVPWSAR